MGSCQRDGWRWQPPPIGTGKVYIPIKIRRIGKLHRAIKMAEKCPTQDTHGKAADRHAAALERQYEDVQRQEGEDFRRWAKRIKEILTVEEKEWKTKEKGFFCRVI